MQFVPTLYEAEFVLQLQTKDYVQTYCTLDTQSNVHCACQPKQEKNKKNLQIGS